MRTFLAVILMKIHTQAYRYKKKVRFLTGYDETKVTFFKDEKQDRQCKYDGTLRRFRKIIVAV